MAKFKRKQKTVAEIRERALAILNGAGYKVAGNAPREEIARLLLKLQGENPKGKIDRERARRILLMVDNRRASDQSVKVFDRSPKRKKKYEQTDAFLRSPEWKAIRYQALVLHGGQCQCCGASAKDGAHLQVDHIRPRSKFPALALDINNLQVLCADCNAGKSNVDQTDWRDDAMAHMQEIVRH